MFFVYYNIGVKMVFFSFEAAKVQLFLNMAMVLEKFFCLPGLVESPLPPFGKGGACRGEWETDILLRIFDLIF